MKTYAETKDLCLLQQAIHLIWDLLFALKCSNDELEEANDILLKINDISKL